MPPVFSLKKKGGKEKKKNMEKNQEISSTQSAGGYKKSREQNIGHLENALSREIALRAHFHYDELCRVDGRSRIRAVRTENGSVDVLGTFLKARRDSSVSDGRLDIL